MTSRNTPNAATMAADLAPLAGGEYLAGMLADVAEGRAKTAEAVADAASVAVLFAGDLLRLAAALTNGASRQALAAAADMVDRLPGGAAVLAYTLTPAGHDAANVAAVAAD